jgi:MarR family transcriptional regulator, organic hydroperoxide resistance regulator
MKGTHDNAGFHLWNTSNLWQHEMKRALEPHRLTSVQYTVLASAHNLAELNEEVTQNEIAKDALTDPMTTSIVLRWLQEKKLVARKPHKGDTRANSVSITAAGTALLKKAMKDVEMAEHEFFGKLKGQQAIFKKNLETFTIGAESE